MKAIALLGCATVLGCFPATLVAQEPAQPVQMRRAVEDAFSMRVRRQLGLDSAQAMAVGKVLTEWGTKRRNLEAEERQFNALLARQLRPGVAADESAVVELVDRLLGNRVAYAESFEGEMRELAAILTPVQRAQFLMMRDQVLRSVRELQERRWVDGVPVRPGTTMPRNRP